MKAKSIIITFVASVAVFSGCSKWTVPQNLDYRHKTPEQENPEAYAEYLNALRTFKQTEHPVMIVTMNGSQNYPSSQNAHLMAMPDSADYICVNLAGSLHPVIASEIPQVKEKKGTRAICLIDYAAIYEAWCLEEDRRNEEGKQPGTADDASKFFSDATKVQLARCAEYGFHGLMMSYATSAGTDVLKAAQKAFTDEVKSFLAQHKDLEFIFRGSARNINDVEFLGTCKYAVIIAGEEKKLSLLPGRILGRTSPVSDRVIMELTVPTTAEPDQKGVSPAEGAQWVLDEARNSSFTPKGLCVSNAHDDYYHKDKAFKNVRDAIMILNKKVEQNENN
ncbi:MAG: glycoside hydrolase family 18 [Candidatus Cryptobacteroides sp.]